MDKSKAGFLGRVVCWFFVGVLVAACGCRGNAEQTGKFSEAEMAELPLASRDGLPEPSGGVVLSINTDTITVEEIISPVAEPLETLAGNGDFGAFRKQAKPVIAQAILSKTTDILLYQQARKHAPENIDEALEKVVENEVNKFVAGYGGNYAQAQNAIKRMGMDWQGFRDYQKKLLLTQSYISRELADDRPVTHSEMLQYYNFMKAEHFQWEGKVEFRLIDIVVDESVSNELSSENQAQPKAAALNKAEGLLTKIHAGQSFAELAKRYSDGHRAGEGGLWAQVTIGSLARPYDILEKHTERMEPGEVSELIESDGHIFIMKLIDKRPAGHKSFEEVQQRIEAEIRFRRRKAQFDKMVSKLLTQANIADMDRFAEFCIVTAYRRYSMK